MSQEEQLRKKYSFHYDFEGWKQEYRKFLQGKYLPRCFVKVGEAEQELIEKMTDDKYMSTWIALVTHKTYRPGVNENYERAEHYGDRGQAQKLSFFVYVKYPDFTEDDVSNIQTEYLSKEQQANWSEMIGLPRFFRGFIPITMSIKEDLFEAVYAGIHLVGNNIAQDLGETLGKNFVYDLFKDIDLTTVKKDPKTRYKDIIEMKNWSDGPVFEENYTVRNYGKNQSEYSLYLPKRAVDEINRKFPKRRINGPIASQIVDSSEDRKKILKKMYTNALGILESYGYIREEILRERTLLDGVVEEELAKELQEKMGEENITDLRIELFKHQVSENVSEYYYQLIGYNPDEGTQEILYMVKINLGLNKVSREKLYNIIVELFLEREKDIAPEERLTKRPLINEYTVE